MHDEHDEHHHRLVEILAMIFGTGIVVCCTIILGGLMWALIELVRHLDQI